MAQSSIPSSLNEGVSKTEDYFSVIDIGSNSVRLVVYSGMKRAPDVVFNEKILCGLGTEVGVTGNMGEVEMDLAISTLKRYSALCKHAGITNVDAIATAAIRDADNGPVFVERAKNEAGVSIRVIAGAEEGRLSALGVIHGAPNARGVMGDLGGGSLELAIMDANGVGKCVSLPIGPLRLQAKFGDNRHAMQDYLRSELAKLKWLNHKDHKSLYLVGGAWRNIAKLMVRERSIPLPIIHNYTASAKDMSVYCKRLSRLKPEDLPYKNELSSRRRDILPIAALVLRETIRAMDAKSFVVSSLGLREGVVYDNMPDDIKAQDPFLSTCQELAVERGRFAVHADKLYDWTRPLFDRKSFSVKAEHERLHRAVCLLSDIAWRGHPDFRAEKAVEEILHGNFIGVDHIDRAYVAVAMNEAYGAAIDQGLIKDVTPSLDVDDLLIARVLGAALRLGHRLTGGTVTMLDKSDLQIKGGKVYLYIDDDCSDIANKTVKKRLQRLAGLLGKNYEIVVR